MALEGLYVKIQCPECKGTGRDRDGSLCSNCIASATRGTVLESADKVREELELQDLQARINKE